MRRAPLFGRLTGAARTGPVTQETARRLKLLADIAGGLLEDADPDEVLRRLMRDPPPELGLDICISYQPDDDARVLRYTYFAGLPEQAGGLLGALPYGTGLCGRVAERREMLIVNDVPRQSRDEMHAGAQDAGFTAYVGFPLLAPGRAGALMGVLAFGSSTRSAFEAEDVEFFATIAHNVATVRNRLHAEEALARNERQFRTLADNIPQLAWMARPDGWTFWFNKRCTDYVGASVDELQGGGWRQFHHPDHADRVDAGMRRCWETGEAWEDTFPLRRHDGAWRWFLSRALPVRDECGRITMWFGTNTDVTEQREAEEVLRQAHRAAEAARLATERADQSKSRFLAAASHDLRQPLQSMLMLTEVLGRHVAPDGREALRHLELGMDALKGLLDSLLDLSRLDGTIATPSLRSFPLSEAIDSLKANFGIVAAAKGLDWQVGGCDGGLTVRSDPTLLGRLLGNLMENAVRYTEAGFVRITTGCDGERVRVTVEDSGIGIPPDHLERIWDEFHQVGNPERDRNCGFGLGLAIVRRLSEMLGHPIDVQSMPGTGSRFTVDLPLGEVIPQPEPMAVPERVLPPAAEGVQGRCVLLVEDDPIVRIGLEAMFQHWGFQVMAAGDGAEAQALLTEGPGRPHVIVSDYRLRGGELGTDVVAGLQDMLGMAVPAIILSGETSGVCAEAAAARGLRLIHKPVKPDQLARALDALACPEGEVPA